MDDLKKEVPIVSKASCYLWRLVELNVGIKYVWGQFTFDPVSQTQILLINSKDFFMPSAHFRMWVNDFQEHPLGGYSKWKWIDSNSVGEKGILSHTGQKMLFLLVRGVTCNQEVVIDPTSQRKKQTPGWPYLAALILLSLRWTACMEYISNYLVCH